MSAKSASNIELHPEGDGDREIVGQRDALAETLVEHHLAENVDAVPSDPGVAAELAVVDGEIDLRVKHPTNIRGESRGEYPRRNAARNS